LEGSNPIKMPRDRVFALLTDSSFIATTLPDAEDVHVLDPDTVEAKVKVKMSIVSSTLKVKLKIVERSPPDRAALFTEGSGSGSNLKIRSVFTLEGTDITTMKWSADADVTGLMAGLGSTVLRGFAEKKVGEIFSGITKAMESRAAG
jgi:carbon monoxide dehydrogenase subunit G